MVASRIVRFASTVAILEHVQIDPASVDRTEATLAPLRVEPAATAILCDLDGTLAPIVDRPGDAAIPERARAALRMIAGRYALTAIVTGRPAAVAREIVGLRELTYAGNHGYELLAPGDEEARPAPELLDVAGDAAAFAALLDDGELDAAGIRIEDKGPIIALHWRGAADENAAEQLTESIASDAVANGLDVHRGRKVLELRPRVRLGKGTAVAALLAESGVRAALYAGDDRTDLDVFAALDGLSASGGLEAAVRVGVRSAEGPAEIVSEADLIVDGPEAMPAILEHLAG